jgi:hypothetical protein
MVYAALMSAVAHSSEIKSRAILHEALLAAGSCALQLTQLHLSLPPPLLRVKLCAGDRRDSKTAVCVCVFVGA